MKQQDKNLIVTSAGRSANVVSRQRIMGVIALGGLFACGLMVGMTFNGNMSRSGSVIGMSKSQCDQISQRIVDAGNGYGCRSDECVSKLRELNQIYSVNCIGRVIPEQEPDKKPKKIDTADMRACEVIEMMQIGNLYEETDTNLYAHDYNISIYQNLIENGCAENKEKYQGLINREKEIITSLGGYKNKRPCEVVEDSLNWRIQDCNDNHIECAKIYAQLAERGCSENAKKYTRLAARELEIARGISDDKMPPEDTVEVVETYKRLQMKSAAQDVINKVQKITDPAIDFILDLEKIVNE